MDLRTVEESEQDKKAKHYGRAYQCLRCLHRENKEVIDVKRRIEAHITKNHLRLDECAHYCRLCFFRCWDRKTLENHVTAYARHTKVTREQKVEGRDDQFLLSNDKHYQLSTTDYEILSKKRSLEYFKKDSSQSTKQQQEREETFMPLSRAFDSLLDIDTPVLGPEVSAVLDTKPELSVQEEQEEPLNLRVIIHRGEQEEDIVGLLPAEKRVIDEEDVQLSPKRPRLEPSPDRDVRVVPKAVAPRKEPSPPAPSSSSCSSDSSITAEKWEEIGMKMMGKLAEAVDQNSRAIRCMGRALEELTKAVEAIARSGKVVQEIMREQARERERQTEELRRREAEGADRIENKENRESDRARVHHEDGRKARTEGESRNTMSTGSEDRERRKFGTDGRGYNNRRF